MEVPWRPLESCSVREFCHRRSPDRLPPWFHRCLLQRRYAIRFSSFFKVLARWRRQAFFSGNWAAFAPPQRRLPHPSRFSKGEDHGPRDLIHPSHTNPAQSSPLAPLLLAFHDRDIAIDRALRHSFHLPWPSTIVM